jgi:hypothetical protein
MRGTIAHTFKLVWRFRQLEARALRRRRGGKSEEWCNNGLSRNSHIHPWASLLATNT